MIYVCLNCENKWIEELPTIGVKCQDCFSSHVKELEGFELDYSDAGSHAEIY